MSFAARLAAAQPAVAPSAHVTGSVPSQGSFLSLLPGPRDSFAARLASASSAGVAAPSPPLTSIAVPALAPAAPLKRTRTADSPDTGLDLVSAGLAVREPRSAAPDRFGRRGDGMASVWKLDIGAHEQLFAAAAA